MKKLSVILIILFSNFLCFAQQTVNPLENAMFALQQKNINLAEKEIQRALFFCNDEAKKVDILLIAADIFSADGKKSDALQFLNSAYHTSDNQIVKDEIIIKKTDLLIFNNQFQEAKISAFQIVDRADSISFNKKYLRLAICEFCLQNYTSSKEYFQKITPDVNKEKLDKIFSKIKRLKNPRSKLASVLSIIPGLGQYYSANIWQGIGSEALIGATVALFIVMQNRYGTLSAFLAVFPWFQRYYVGGIKNAGRCAQNRRAIKRNKLLNAALKNV